MGPDEARSASVFERTVQAHPDHVAAVRRAAVDFAAHAGAPEPLQADIALVVGEACANVVIHAYAGEEPGPMSVSVEAREDSLTIIVADEGIGMVPRPDSPGLGLGLPLIANLSDRLEIRDGPKGTGTLLEMVFSLDR